MKRQDGRGGAGKTRPQEDQGIQGALQPKEVIGHEPSRECATTGLAGRMPGRWVGALWAGAGPAGEGIVQTRGGSGNDGHVGSAEWSSPGESRWKDSCH